MRSETLSTRTPSIERTICTTDSACPESAQATVRSRITASRSTRTRSIAPSIPADSAIACATAAKALPCCGSRSRIVKE
ncbi:MAG TPA: hypothetical protein VKB28_06855 [Solirubrobacteraceae bacterium]|nr:hypothetical protein [Solirubrobacteraceae bacterium]